MITKEKLLEEISKCKDCYRFHEEISTDHVTPCLKHLRMIIAFFFGKEDWMDK